jgi:hypothetical protein
MTAKATMRRYWLSPDDNAGFERDEAVRRRHEAFIHSQVVQHLTAQDERIKASPNHAAFDKEVAELFERTPKGAKGDDAIFDGIDALRRKHFEAEGYTEAYRRIEQEHHEFQDSGVKPPSTVAEDFASFKTRVRPVLNRLLRDPSYLKSYSKHISHALPAVRQMVSDFDWHMVMTANDQFPVIPYAEWQKLRAILDAATTPQAKLAQLSAFGKKHHMLERFERFKKAEDSERIARATAEARAVTIRRDKAQDEALEQLATKTNRSKRGILRDAVNDYLRKQKAALPTTLGRSAPLPRRRAWEMGQHEVLR